MSSALFYAIRINVCETCHFRSQSITGMGGDLAPSLGGRKNFSRATKISEPAFPEKFTF